MWINLWITLIKTMISSANGPMDSIHLLDLRYDWAIWNTNFDGYIRII
jgi:hypothetical protein